MGRGWFSFGADYDQNFSANGGLNLLPESLRSERVPGPRVSQSERLGPPIYRLSKIVCIGLNFRDHATETKAQLPAEPVIFFKSTTAVVGPNDDLVIPKDAERADWEVEPRW